MRNYGWARIPANLRKSDVWPWPEIPATLYICTALMLALLVGIAAGLESLLRPRR